MSKIILGLLIILTIYSQTNAYVTLSQIKTLIEWGKELHASGLRYYNKYHKDNPKPLVDIRLKDIMEKVNEMSSQLNTSLQNINKKLDSMLRTLLTNIRVSISLQPLKTQLTNYINTVERYYNDAIAYTNTKKIYANDTLINFAHLVLSTSDNLPSTLVKIHQLMTNTKRDGYLQLLLHDTLENFSHDCNKNISAQQEMYFTYIRLLLAEMKGFAILNQVYLIKQAFTTDNYNYTNELSLANERYEQRLVDYGDIIHKFVDKFPREIRCCDVNPPKRGINYIELENLVRTKIWGEAQLVLAIEKKVGYDPAHSSGLCYKSCSKITKNGPQNVHHYSVTNCQYLGGSVSACRTSNNPYREYEWVRNNKVSYGHVGQCEYVSDLSGTSQWNIPNCDTCICTAYINDSAHIQSIKHINLEPQLSDMINNMVVTGVKFVVHHNVLTLRIQENKFLSGGISNTSGTWRSYSRKADTLHINYNWRAMYLDDIIVPDNYVVTGVKFEKVNNPNGIQLFLYATSFDFNTGKLNLNDFIMVGPNAKHSLRPNDYERPRMEIIMDDADDPARGDTFHHDPATNKYVEFIHTDVKKDVGQTTIPLIESLPVESVTTFPLSGVGLTFKGKYGYGGYIAPRIYTLDVSKYIDTYK